MYLLKGFINNSKLASAAPAGTLATIGALSEYSSTYAVTKSMEFQESSPDLFLVSFTSQDESGAVGVPAGIATQVLNFAAWIYAQTQAVPNPGEIAAQTLLDRLLATFQTEAQNFTCGPMATDGTYWVPEWLQWENLTDPVYGEMMSGGTCVIRIWFTDSAFGSQYDDYTILVVPPVANLDDFFTTSSSVAALVAAQTYTDTIALVNTARGNFPETMLEAQSFNYIDPNNAENTILTNWTILIYGLAGNNIDSVAGAIINFILANSTHDQADWEAILPEIFKRTEFTLVPMWDQFAIPDRSQQRGIYSPVANLGRANTMIGQVAAYGASHINANACVQTVPYKSIALVSCGSPSNQNNAFQIVDVFPDLLGVPSQSVDFNRMAVATQNFLLLLVTMLVNAETLTQYGSVPAGMTKLTRNNVLYLVTNYNNISYLMVTKSSFPLAGVPAPEQSAETGTTS
ncbi:hypothetical protein [Paraburkholderia adhaesiva]|uniref:hypothetical protein n=1 Tax=Paraburkholderia adhaesiva TaxID=2883244 RepID=UPI001F1C8848|nr:hypothetical protein [Paraburkholderia adhaesiva]